MRILIIDGYSQASRAKLSEAGMTYAWKLYADMLLDLRPEADYSVFFPSDSRVEDFPDGEEMEQYDGIIWTGADLDINHTHVPTIQAQIELARTAYEVGVDMWGSCWGIQMAAVAAGGSVIRNPRGREMGIGRGIVKTAEGREHPMLAGKPEVFTAFESHYDIVDRVPEGGTVLARNSFSGIQAMVVHHRKGTFWASQYHPEYNLHEIARLTMARAEVLIGHGFFRDEAAVRSYVDVLEAIFRSPGRTDLMWQFGIDADVLDDTIRRTDFRSWLAYLDAERRQGS